MSRTNVAKAGFWYVLANILIKGINFITLPIFSRLLSPFDFGIYNVFIAYDAILFVIIGFALHSSVKTANWKYKGKIDEYISSITLLYLLNIIFLVFVSIVFEQSIYRLSGFNFIIVFCLIIHSAGNAVVTLYNTRISLQYSYKKYMLVAASSSIGNVALSLVLILTVFDSQRYFGRIIGSAAALGIVGLLLIIYFWKQAKPRINLRYWKFGLSYSLPIIFHGLSQVLLAQMGRLLINALVSTVAAGIYGLAANLQIVLTTITDPLGTIWSTWFYEKMQEDVSSDNSHALECSRIDQTVRNRRIQQRAMQLSGLFAVLTIGLIAVVPEMIWVLGGDEYMEGAFCAFGMLLSGYCVFLYNIIVVGEYYTQQTQYIMWATLAAAFFNIVFDYLAIKWIGYIAVSYATLVAYAIYVTIHWIISKKLLGFSIVPLFGMLWVSALLVLSTVVSHIFFETLFFRLFLNCLIALFILIPLVKSLDGVQGIKELIGR